MYRPMIPALLLIACTGGTTADTPTSARATPTFSRVWDPPADTLPEELASCAVLHETRCASEVEQRCALWDADAVDWATNIPAITEQAFTFDRFYDRYHSPVGQAMDFEFTEPMLAGTPEDTWSDPEVFQRFAGIGDASGWTGTALWGAAARYATTGTSADYTRMLDAAEAMGLLYEVTGVPGLLARSHWAMLAEGAPEPHAHPDKAITTYRLADGTDGHYHLPIPEELLPRLPAYYTEGVRIDGVDYATSPHAMSDASRDMYVRALPGMLAAWDQLGEGPREDAIREVYRTQLPATLNRLVKGRVTNLQSSDGLRAALASFLSGPSVEVDEGDLDVDSVDEIIFYVMEQPHPDHLDTFAVEPPPGPPMDFDPRYEIDLASPEALGSLLTFMSRQQRQGEEPIAWVMYAGAVASDAVFLTQWALTAHYVTGEPAYLDFVDQLMDESPYWPIVRTWGALQLPRFCAPHYAPSLGYPSVHNLLARIDPSSDYWRQLAEVAHDDVYGKENARREDAFFGMLYHRMVDLEIDPGRDTYVAEMADLLATYGSNPEDKLQPDRNVPRRWLSEPHPSVQIETIAPGDPEWSTCEDPVPVLGLEVPPPRIDGEPSRSVDPLPLDMRIGGAFLWQMDPWMLERDYGGVGMDEQWPMLGMTVPYWIGRADGTIREGAGLALAWRDTGEVCD